VTAGDDVKITRSVLPNEAARREAESGQQVQAANEADTARNQGKAEATPRAVDRSGLDTGQDVPVEMGTHRAHEQRGAGALGSVSERLQAGVAQPVENAAARTSGEAVRAGGAGANTAGETFEDVRGDASKHAGGFEVHAKPPAKSPQITTLILKDLENPLMRGGFEPDTVGKTFEGGRGDASKHAGGFGDFWNYNESVAATDDLWGELWRLEKDGRGGFRYALRFTEDNIRYDGGKITPAIQRKLDARIGKGRHKQSRQDAARLRGRADAIAAKYRRRQESRTLDALSANAAGFGNSIGGCDTLPNLPNLPDEFELPSVRSRFIN
jgi:hypothetical protein